MSTLITRIETHEDGGAYLMRRVTGNAGANIVQADISSIAYRVTDLEDASEVDSGSLTVSAVIFDTLQTDSRWTKDTTGYNFGWQTLATQRPTGGKVNQIEVTLNPVSGEPIQIKWIDSVLETIRS